MEAETTVKTTGSGVQTGTGTVSSDFIRFNPAPDTWPGFLKRESSMLNVLNWYLQDNYTVLKKENIGTDMSFNSWYLLPFPRFLQTVV